MSKANLLLGLLVASLIAFRFASADASCQDNSGNTLPVYFGGGRMPFVLAGLDGTPAAMLLDTGGALSFITPDMSRQAGLLTEPLNDGVQIEGEAGVIPAQETVVHQFVLGSATGSNFTIGVMLLANKSYPKKDPINALDGSIGVDILSNYDIDMNFPGQQLTLYPLGDCTHSGPPWTAGAVGVPFSLDGFGRVHFQMTIEGKSFETMLDTGATYATMSRPMFISSGLSLRAGRPIGMIQSNAAGGYKIPLQIYRLDQAEIGGQSLGSVELAVSMGPMPGEIQALKSTLDVFSGPVAQPDTSIGEIYLRNHRIFISNATHTLYVQPSPLN